jgi:hypothetical protein
MPRRCPPSDAAKRHLEAVAWLIYRNLALLFAVQLWGVPALQMLFKSNYGYMRGNSVGERSGLRLVFTDVAKRINRSGLTTCQIILAFPTPLENKKSAMYNKV